MTTLDEKKLVLFGSNYQYEFNQILMIGEDKYFSLKSDPEDTRWEHPLHIDFKGNIIFHIDKYPNEKLNEKDYHFNDIKILEFKEWGDEWYVPNINYDPGILDIYSPLSQQVDLSTGTTTYASYTLSSRTKQVEVCDAIIQVEKIGNNWRKLKLASSPPSPIYLAILYLKLYRDRVEIDRELMSKICKSLVDNCYKAAASRSE